MFQTVICRVRRAFLSLISMADLLQSGWVFLPSQYFRAHFTFSNFWALLPKKLHLMVKAEHCRVLPLGTLHLQLWVLSAAQDTKRRVKFLFVGPFHIKMPIARLPEIAWCFQSIFPSDWDAIHPRTGRVLAVCGGDLASLGTATKLSCMLLQMCPQPAQI